MIPLHWQYNKKSTHRTLKRSGPFPNINTSSTENCLARWSSVQRVTWPHSKNWEAYRSCVCNKNLSHFTYYDNSQILCSRSSKCTYHYTFRQFLCIITPYYRCIHISEWRTTCRMEVINSMSRHRDYYFHRLKTCHIINIL